MVLRNQLHHLLYQLVAGLASLQLLLRLQLQVDISKFQDTKDSSPVSPLLQLTSLPHLILK